MQDAMAYRQGIYFMEALKATVLNSLAGRRVHEYPKQPIGIQLDEKDEVEKFFAEQAAMRANWKANHRGKA